MTKGRSLTRSLPIHSSPFLPGPRRRLEMATPCQQPFGLSPRDLRFLLRLPVPGSPRLGFARTCLPFLLLWGLPPQQTIELGSLETMPGMQGVGSECNSERPWAVVQVVHDLSSHWGALLVKGGRPQISICICPGR